jgi:hypothetical protein
MAACERLRNPVDLRLVELRTVSYPFRLRLVIGVAKAFSLHHLGRSGFGLDALFRKLPTGLMSAL